MDQKFSELKFILKNKDKQSIKMDAHGGFSVLFVYPPKEEKIYLKRLQEEYPNEHFIDMAKMFVEYIDSFSFESFEEIYREYSSEPEKLFRSEISDDDFLKRILREIEQAGKENKIPILIRTGALYGTGIENINFMDSIVVQNLLLPQIIMYPASLIGDNKLKFLNFKLASDYRAVEIY